MSVDPNLSQKFMQACQSGDLSRVETLASERNLQDWTLFQHSTSGDTALHVAAREGHLNVVRYLCEAFDKPDFRVDVANKDMKRPLHDAAQFARSDVVKYLIEKGADVNALRRADWTPLMLACTKTGSEACECIATLLQAEANPFIQNKDGWTSLHIVCRAGDPNALDLLLKSSSECISRIDDRTFHGHKKIIERLAAIRPCLVNARDSSGHTPVHEAIKGDHLPAAERIIELGADVQATDNVGQTVLHVAALAGNTDAVRYILNNNLIDIHAEASFNVTPLVAARRSNHTDTIQCLIEFGAVK